MEPFLQAFSSASFLTAALLLLLVYLFYRSKTESQECGREPPGPKPMPILGNLLHLVLKRADTALLELSRKYGSVFTIHLGEKKAVVLAGYRTIKEAFVTHAEEFGEREAPLVAQDAGLHHGIAWANGESWKEMRRFALTNLRDFGMGKRACEDKILDESQVLIQEFKKFKGGSFETHELVNYAVSNIICSMVYGNRFEYDDPDFQSIVNRTSLGIHMLGTPAIRLYNWFPSAGKLFSSARKKMSDIFAANKSHHLMLLNRLKESFNPQACRGVADAFMLRQQQHKVEHTNPVPRMSDDSTLLQFVQAFKDN